MRKSTLDKQTALSALWTPDQLAEHLGRTKQALAIWRMKGRGPRFLKIENGYVRYRVSDVEAWLAAQATGGSAA